MALRTEALFNGQIIGIESIYTVIDGCQINIPEKLKDLRQKSQSNQLFCPCGCGNNLTLVAGDRNLREQHFRIKDGGDETKCHVVTEGKVSVQSKIVLKCWMDDKLALNDLQCRVPVFTIGDSDRKYEFTFLSESKSIALSYSHERSNILDEKLKILEDNSKNIHIIYVVDEKNAGCNGQYPEGVMKIQNVQGYCLFLHIEDINYLSARMKAAYYIENVDGLWEEVSIAESNISNFSIDEVGNVIYAGKNLRDILAESVSVYNEIKDKEIEKREKIKKEREEQRQKRIVEIQQRENEQAKMDAERKRLMEKEAAEMAEKKVEFQHIIESGIVPEKDNLYDENGVRWIKCEFCGKFGRTGEFSSYQYSLGTCYECSRNNPKVKSKIDRMFKNNANSNNHINNDNNMCPECGGRLVLKNGKYGQFWGCSNYPTCRFTK